MFFSAGGAAAKRMKRVELKFCMEVTRKLYENPLAKAFIHPVNPELDGAYDYDAVIKNPMDLGKIKKKLEMGEYPNSEKWKSDIKLVWDNAKKYNNDKKSILYKCADKLHKKCQKIFKCIPKDESEEWLLRLEKANTKLTKFLHNVPICEDSSYPRLPEYSPAEK